MDSIEMEAAPTDAANAVSPSPATGSAVAAPPPAAGPQPGPSLMTRSDFCN